MRVRFAPSPTGALHIGGVRTALYNYLLAKKHGGSFILRIEDTDSNRYVPGAEAYIREALSWCGMNPDEGPEHGGEYGPYRQSERKGLYGQYAQQLLDQGKAYYAFDSAEDLQKRREELEAKKEVFRYDASTRMSLKNSLTLSKEESDQLVAQGSYTVRLQIPSDEKITIQDIVRGEVSFNSNELDDKIILKSDGMPTYHLANIVDDHLMKITHVIRGEEWLPSTAHHVYLYRFLNWEDEMPQFAHLPLILKPTGKGKLSKRDGAKLGIPVFPLEWKGKEGEDDFEGFRESGFLPAAVNNFLAFLGWNPGTEQEIFSLDQLVESFTLERVSKAGARFDFDKAKWFNQQYLMQASDEDLAAQLTTLAVEKGYNADKEYLAKVAGMMKERVHTLPEIIKDGYYFFTDVAAYEEKMIRKKWKPERTEMFGDLINNFESLSAFSAEAMENTTKAFMEKNELGFGDVLPMLRLSLCGTMKGPSIFDVGALLGKETVKARMQKGIAYFNKVKAANA